MTDPDIIKQPDEDSPLFHRAIETSELLKKLQTVKIDAILTYDETDAVAMGGTRPGEIKAHYLRSARVILQKQTGIEFQAIPNIGLKRMNDTDKITKSRRSLQGYNRKAKRDIRRLTSCDYPTLSAEQKLAHNAQISVLNAIKTGSSGDRINRVEKRIQATGVERLALEETLKQFI